MFTVILSLVVVFALAKPLGTYIAHVMNGEVRYLHAVEEVFYAAGGVNQAGEMNWKTYAWNLVLFSLLGFLLLFGIVMFEPGMTAHLAFNIAVSFVTNTNWQSYGGEMLSSVTQMAGLAVQNFLSAAVGIAAAFALFRGIKRRQTTTIGNAWIDVTRAVLYILLPLALLYGVLLSSQGVVQTFNSQVEYTPLEQGLGLEAGGLSKEPASSAQALGPKPQALILGPVASQVAIKMVGSNGGGYFNANGAHPFENPTPFSNFIQLVSILLIPVALVYAFGVMLDDRRQGIAILAAMTLIFLPMLGACLALESKHNPAFNALPIAWVGGNMEGKEVRFGLEPSVLWSVATTATSNGSVNNAHDSLMPLAGMVPMLMIQLGEVVYGGVGSGIYGMLVFVLIAVFIGGLMVGRTPEYMGKKLGVFEIKMASIAIILPAALTLVGAAIAVMSPAGVAGILNAGPQGFSEVLYAFSSAANNNGSAFAGLSANTPFYNVLLGIIMLLGRFLVMIPALAIAGALAQKNIMPQHAGTLPTHTPLFVVMLIAVVVLLDVLTYAPSLALGPVAEHMHLFTGAAL